MSYDIYLRSEPCPTCQRSGNEPDHLPDPTYNLTQIFDLALTDAPFPNPNVGEAAVVLFKEKTDRPRGLRILSGRTAKDTESTIATALRRLQDPDLTADFVALEPPNKWGTLKDAVYVMEKLHEAAKEYPENVWEIR